ncbi:unnamed protein product [Lampetra fluviatilis]
MYQARRPWRDEAAVALCLGERAARRGCRKSRAPGTRALLGRRGHRGVIAWRECRVKCSPVWDGGHTGRRICRDRTPGTMALYSRGGSGARHGRWSRSTAMRASDAVAPTYQARRPWICETAAASWLGEGAA